MWRRGRRSAVRRRTWLLSRSTPVITRPHHLGAGLLRLFAERLVPLHAVDGDGARGAAAERDLGAGLGVDEGAGDAVDDRLFADLGLRSVRSEISPEQCEGTPTARCSSSSRTRNPRARQVPRRPRARGPGADDGDVAVETHVVFDCRGVTC